jgi:signal peptidase I
MSNTSMLPTISVGMAIKITKQFDSLKYGDIVVFNYSGEIDNDFSINGKIISRIVGLPGDSIAIEKEFCIINGKENKHRLIQKGVINKDINNYFSSLVAEYEEQLPNGDFIHIYKYEITKKDLEKYGDLFTNNGTYEHAYKDMKPIKIPDNEYFTMGDFRDNKFDSRYIGTIPREQIFGKVIEIKQKKK